MIDRETLERRIGHINYRLTQLRARRTLTLQEFLANEERLDATLYELQTCLEAVTDISNHLIAALGLREPHDRGDTLTVLGEAGLLSPDLAERLVKAVGLRNVLVHGYLGVLIETVYDALQDDLGDIEKFCQQIVEYLNTNL